MASLEREKSRIDKLKRVQLPNYFKKIGLGLALLSVVALVFNKMTVDVLLAKTLTKYALLFGLLLISLSKEKIEDERIILIRMRSFMIAFLIGVIYTIVIPFVDAIVDNIFLETVTFEPIKDILILWILLSMQIFSFEVLKRKSA